MATAKAQSGSSIIESYGAGVRRRAKQEMS